MVILRAKKKLKATLTWLRIDKNILLAELKIKYGGVKGFKYYLNTNNDWTYRICLLD